jgi:beta-galactosidase
MQGGLLLLLLLSVAGSQPCNPAARFPYNWSGIETSGLSSSPNATTAAQCAAACCASQSCTTWQFCPAATSCGSATHGPSCWTGDATLPKYSAGGWVGAATLPLPSDRAVTLSRNPVPMPIPLCPPVTNPATGDTLSVDTLSLRINGQPILPVSGEMHPSRVPVDSWRSDLMRMKAGGVSLVYAYIMWLHTEEVQGQPDFGGNRNVTLFLQTAKEVGLLVALRIGPWDHGECRNGGFPDWVLQACQSGGFKCRNNNTGFMSLTQRQYSALAQAMQGYGYEEGGPLVIIQVDNEISDVEYLEALKDMGVALGMKPAFWVKTGWPAPSSPVPYGSLLPLFGGYPDDFWSSIQDTSYGNFLFNSNPNPAPLPPNTAADAEPYPFFTVEVGGGMASSYHRRIFIDPEDVTAQALVFYGSGVASLGFYSACWGASCFCVFPPTLLT